MSRNDQEVKVAREHMSFRSLLFDTGCFVPHASDFWAVQGDVIQLRRVPVMIHE
jgi:hypothetical protein